MFKDVHHLAVYGMDVAPFTGFLNKYFRLKLLKVEREEDRVMGGTFHIWQLGPSLLEFNQPPGRVGVFYDFVRRNGGPVISHIAWKVKDHSKRIEEIVSRGGELWLPKAPGGRMGTKGGFRVACVLDETTRGLSFQFAEDLTPDEIEKVEREGTKYKTGGVSASAGVTASGERIDPNRWLAGRTEEEGILTHVHHVCYLLWGLDYMVDYMEKVFGVKPFTRTELPEHGLRGAYYRFGRTIAEFVEPTQFGGRYAEFMRRGGPLPGYEGGGVHHVGFAVKDLDSRVRELKRAGMKFVQVEPIVSPHGGYRLINVAPEIAGGVRFQLCEDLEGVGDHV